MTWVKAELPSLSKIASVTLARFYPVKCTGLSRLQVLEGRLHSAGAGLVLSVQFWQSPYSYTCICNLKQQNRTRWQLEKYLKMVIKFSVCW